VKLSRLSFTRLWAAHAWLGVTCGLVLHVMFFAGGFALFHDELSAWQEPELSRAPPEQSVGRLVARALEASAAPPVALEVTMPGPNRPFVELAWTETSGARGEARLEAASGRAAPETSHLARVLFWLHFLYHPRVPWGMNVAGLFGAALLLALVTGLLIHLKDLVRQLYQLRADRSPRVLWSDLHKVLGVMGLPFQIAYALTGAVIGLAPVMLSLATGPIFHGDRAAAARALWGESAAPVPAGRRAPALPLDDLLSRARAVVPGFEPDFARLDNLGDAAARAAFWGRRPGRLFARGDVVLRATDGALIADGASTPPTPGAAVTRWATGLHYVWFGGVAARILCALLAAAACLTILSGNWIWLARRESTAARAGNRLLLRLTIGIGGGLLLGTAGLFWANRLAPPAARLDAETWAFFGTWAATATLFAARAESRGGWVGLLRLAGAAFTAVPLLTAARFAATASWAGVAAALGGVDTALAGLGLLLLLASEMVQRAAARATARGSGPLDRPARRPVAARVLPALLLAAVLAAVRVGQFPTEVGEAVLFALAAFTTAVSIFVPLAALRPRWAWHAALAAPVVALALLAVEARAR